MRGFTLVETMIVLVIIGAVFATALPRIQSTALKEAVRGARLTVGTQLSQARGTAATRGCPAVLHVIRGGSARSWITSCTATGAPGVDTVGAVNLLSAKYAVSLTGTLDSITFAPNGLANGTGWSSLTFLRAGYTDTLAVSPVGRAVW